MTTKEQVLEDLGRFAEKFPKRRIVCLDNDNNPVFINCVEFDEEFWRYTLIRDEESMTDMTVGDLMECLNENISDDTDPEGDEAEVIVCLDEDEYSQYLDDSLIG